MIFIVCDTLNDKPKTITTVLSLQTPELVDPTVLKTILGGRAEMPEVVSSKTLTVLRNAAREHEHCKKDLRDADESINRVEAERDDNRIKFEAAIKKVQSDCEKEKARADEYKNGAVELGKDLVQIHDMIWETAEASRDRRPAFYRYIYRIHNSSDASLKSRKLVVTLLREFTTLLKEFESERGASRYLKELQLDLQERGEQPGREDRAAVRYEISTRIRDFRLSRHDEIDDLRRRFDVGDNDFDNKEGEIWSQQRLKDGLSLSVQPSNGDHENIAPQWALGRKHSEEQTQTNIHRRDLMIEINHLNGDLATMQGMYAEEIARLLSGHENQVACLETEHRVAEDELKQKIQQEEDENNSRLIEFHEKYEGLRRIYNERVRELQSHTTTIAGMESKLAVLEKRHARELERVSKASEEEILSIQAKHANEATRLNEKIDKLKQDLEQQKKLLPIELDKLEAAHTSRMQSQSSNLNDKINKLRQELRLEKEKLQIELTKLGQSHDSRMQAQSRIHDANEEKLRTQLSETRRSHDRDIDQLEAEYVSIIQSERNTYSDDLNKIKQDHQAQSLRWQQDLTNEKDNRALDRANLIDEHNHEIGNIKAEYQTELKKLTTELKIIGNKHAVELRELRSSFQHEIEAYCAALLARDKFTPLPDPEIGNNFIVLKQDVDALSLARWKTDRTKWSEKELRQLSDNQESLKQKILQDIIWRCLDEFIFCSPFRVLGDEGRILEKQWNQACGGPDPRFMKDFYTWPKPAMETERWRYVTIKECRAALRMRLPSEWDSRAKLKKSFKSSLEKLRAAVGTRLAEIAEYNQGSVELMEKMTRKAVNMWLEFGEQRCRIMIVEAQLDGEPVDWKKNKSMNLMVLPEVRRFGKSDGQDLDIEEVIKGCEGTTIRYDL